MATPANLQAIRENIFAAAHPVIKDWDRFPWHRPEKGAQPDADRPHSSQAFCISLWGTVSRPEGAEVRTVISQLVDDGCIERHLGQRCPELTLEFADRDLLGEHGAGTPTTVDARLHYRGFDLIIESKLT
jgi:hypothetical protein